MQDQFDNRPWSERYRIAAEEWVDKEAAADLLENTKSAIFAQRQVSLGSSLSVAKAALIVKASPSWYDHLEMISEARKAANAAKVHVEYIKMQAWEENNANANARAERRL